MRALWSTSFVLANVTASRAAAGELGSNKGKRSMDDVVVRTFIVFYAELSELLRKFSHSYIRL